MDYTAARAGAALAPRWTIDVRIGDTGTAPRTRYDKRLPTALVTTPESLTQFLTAPTGEAGAPVF